MRRRRIRSDHNQARLRPHRKNPRHHAPREPFQRDGIGSVPKPSQEEHRFRISWPRYRFIPRRIDSRPQSLLQILADARQKRRQVFPILARANLHPIAARQHTHLIPQRPQILEARRNLSRPRSPPQPPRNRLEVDIVLKQNRRQLLVSPGILRKRRILQLQHVDLASVELPVNQPVQVVILKLAHRMRNNRPQVACPSLHAHQKISRVAEFAQLFIRRQLVRMIEQRHHVDFRQPRQLSQRLVHEHPAAVRRRADRIRRDKQHEVIEPVAKVSAERPQERFRVGKARQRSSPPARPQRLWQMQEGPPQSREIGSPRFVPKH